LGFIHASDDPATSPQGNEDQRNDEHASHDGELNPQQSICLTHKDIAPEDSYPRRLHTVNNLEKIGQRELQDVLRLNIATNVWAVGGDFAISTAGRTPFPVRLFWASTVTYHFCSAGRDYSLHCLFAATPKLLACTSDCSLSRRL
jgi:hypothetical protein